MTKLKRPTQKHMAIAFGVSTRTIRRFLKPRTILKLGRKPKQIDRLTLNYLLWGYAPENPAPTQQEMANFISERTGQSISRQTVARLLKKHGITRKKINYHYADQLKHKDKIKKFVEKIPFLSESPVSALDECSFHLNEVPRYAYAEKGKRANHRKPSKKGENHTLIFCIKNVAGQGVVHWELIKGGMKTKNFHEFLTNLQLPIDKKHYLLLDNLKVHHAKQSCQKLGLAPIKDLLASKNIEPQYLPPYTPELNPVELCFNFLRKNTEKRKPRTTEELKISISKAIENLQRQDLTKYFQHCWNYFDENGVPKKEASKYAYSFSRNETLHWAEKGQLAKPELLHPKIYPSWRWMRWGTKPNWKDFSSIRKKIKHCIMKSKGYKKTHESGTIVWKKDGWKKNKIKL